MVGSRRCREARWCSNSSTGSWWAGNRGGGDGAEFPAELEVEKFKGWIEI